MFTHEELLELKSSLNTMIQQRLLYLHSITDDKEIQYTKDKLQYDYELLNKILKLLEK